MAKIEKIIRKSLSDNRDYLLHTLKNGLRCLLISQPAKEPKNIANANPDGPLTAGADENYDSSSDACGSSDDDDDEPPKDRDLFAMSLCVHVGSFSDPAEAQGLAHLLEHMISMGSERHPEDNYFDRFLSRRGGFSNAETGCEYTKFYFEIPMEYFEEASDIFASMFCAPKLAKQSIDKEKQVVDSEFRMAINDDDNRLQRLISLCANKDNPAGKFCWGNLESLNHTNLDELVVDFWKNHYSASRMTLAVQSTQPTCEMVEWIDNLFSLVPTDHRPAPEFKIGQEPFCSDRFHKIYKIISEGSIKKIVFSWHLPSVMNLYKCKPLEYIAWIVGHEGKGTLINHLRKLNYAMELEAGVEDDFHSNSIYSVLSVSIELTNLGLKHVFDIISMTFGYLNLIRKKGISEKVFRQIQILADNDFNFSENKTAIDHVTELSENMLMYNEEDYLSGPALYDNYAPETIAEFLSLLTANRVCIFIFSKQFDDTHQFNKDPIFETKYATENITKELENKWSTAVPHPFFVIPSENHYLITDFAILPLSNDIKHPVKIFENDHIELWHKQDNVFKLPRTYAMFYFITRLPSKSLDNHMLLDLFLDSVVFLLNEDTYSAIMARLNYSVRVYISGFEITFYGFNQKLPLLIDVVMNCIKNYQSSMTEKVFHMVKAKAINNLKNNQYDLDYVPCNFKTSLIQDPDWNIDKRLSCLENLDYKQLLAFHKQLDNFYCRALIQGNIDQTQAIDISKRVVSILNYRPLAKKCFPVVRIKRLNPGDSRITMANYNPKDNNSVAYIYYQFNKHDIIDSVKFYVLQTMMEEPAFDELRTQQCLGYDVQLNITVNHHHYGIYFQVAHQKNKFETQYVINKMNDFVKRFWENIFEEEGFNEVREALKISKATPDDCLYQEFNRNKHEVIEERFKFNRIELEIEGLKDLKVEDVKNLKDGFFGDRRTLNIEIVGHSVTDVTDESSPPQKKVHLENDQNCICMDNFEKFKKDLNYY